MAEIQPHIPVMLDEVLAALAPADGAVYVDGTFGAGGYSRALLDAADCHVIAIDRDPSAQAKAADLTAVYGGRFTFLHGCFGDVLSLMAAAGFDKVDGFVLDLGVSSMQLDEEDRGFSFRYDAPLDMRMDQGAAVPTAADILRTWPEEDIANAIYRYGEERHSRRIARAVVRRRVEKDIETTGELAALVKQAMPRTGKAGRDEIHPATRTFQALRIVVNEELLELEKALSSSASLLKEGGRLVVVSFHSLEDAMVKKFMRKVAGQEAKGSRYAPDIVREEPVLFTLPSKKAVFPSEKEVRINSRSRSARMRVAVRTAAPCMRNGDASGKEARP